MDENFKIDDAELGAITGGTMAPEEMQECNEYIEKIDPELQDLAREILQDVAKHDGATHKTFIRIWEGGHKKWRPGMRRG